ncbi:DUF4230 domain-containing protein [Aureibaculum sp. 2210JD6-5]|uniref:DUF4230 domain-containing protein n=1 Tax=Aureibaculum sp. 2210JD6-5 TaxID=3103957 RepID=UPI002AAE4AE4|nr:DUF4230 domain-containing protein [Aureibaculum sp. 2210JD6-5]MDY7395793.1 DUF4230 domain-containing protein [Aureibaculum sp. 2210JD6-5]
MEFILGLLIGIIILGVLVLVFSKRFSKHKSEEQSVVLLEKIRNVSKMITVEGDFSEIMHFEDVKGVLLNLVISKKKAIVLANAKVMIGFDMKKIRLRSIPERKKLVVEYFPEPEILSIETDIQYYDVKHGYFNKFAASDLSNLNKKVRTNIEEKIPESDLLTSATSKALETVKIIEQMVSTFGWKLDYKGLKFEEKRKIEQK